MSNKMPEFTLKGKDKIALITLMYYRDRCLENNLPEQTAEVNKAITEMSQWQKENLNLMKMPDHKHVPVDKEV